MPAEHDDMAALLGPAALGLLTGAEQQALDDHLAGCAQCRAELVELTDVVDRLADLEGEDALIADLGAGAARAQSVLAAVGAERRRARRTAHRWQGALAAAASVVVLAAGLVTATALTGAEQPAVPTEPVQVVAAQAGGDVDARADLVAHTWGVEIKLVVTGLPAGEPYTVQVRTDEGTVVDAGAFLGTGERQLSCNLNASVLRPDAASFAVLDRAGKRVLEAQL